MTFKSQGRPAPDVWASVRESHEHKHTHIITGGDPLNVGKHVDISAATPYDQPFKRLLVTSQRIDLSRTKHGITYQTFAVYVDREHVEPIQ